MLCLYPIPPPNKIKRKSRSRSFAVLFFTSLWNIFLLLRRCGLKRKVKRRLMSHAFDVVTTAPALTYYHLQFNTWRRCLWCLLDRFNTTFIYQALHATNVQGPRRRNVVCLSTFTFKIQSIVMQTLTENESSTIPCIWVTVTLMLNFNTLYSLSVNMA